MKLVPLTDRSNIETNLKAKDYTYKNIFPDKLTKPAGSKSFP